MEIDESDDEDDDDELESQSHFSPFTSQHGSPRKNSNTSAYGNKASYTSTYYYFADTAPTASPQGSYEDDHSNALQLHESPFGDDDADDVVLAESRKSSCLIRKGSKPKKSAVTETQVEKEEEEPSPRLRSLDEDVEDERASTLVFSLVSCAIYRV